MGARDASLKGHEIAETLARDLGKAGMTIISGMARGIDTSAHNGSLVTGTIAVLAGGANIVYPEENRPLYEQIIEAGCVISDQPLGCEPYAKLFPRRNRLISGLSLGVVIIEATLQSGALVTARMAIEQGREVFAVPGSPLDPRFAGTNDLMRQGALLVEKAEDLLSHIRNAPKGLAPASAPLVQIPLRASDENELPIARAIILDYLSPSPISVDDLIRQSGLTPAVVLTVLLELELAARIERQAGHKVTLINSADVEETPWQEPQSISG